MELATGGLVERRAPLAPLRGVPGLAQGTYGSAGNLELVACDAMAGLWVHWRNNDAEDVRPGARAGAWSAGLHLAGSGRYDAAAVRQTRHGPDNVEVLALRGDAVERLVWQAASGFGPPEPVGAGRVGVALVEEPFPPYRPVAVTAAAEGGVRLLRAEVGGYPALAWRGLRVAGAELGSVEALAADWPAGARTPRLAVVVAGRAYLLAAVDGAWQAEALPHGARAGIAVAGRAVVVAAEAGGAAVLARDGDAGWRRRLDVAVDAGPLDALAACPSTLGPGRVELVLRAGTQLRHAAFAVGDDGVRVVEASRPVATHAWVAADAADRINRGPGGVAVPLVTVLAVPPADEARVDALLDGLVRGVAGALGRPPDDVWARFVPCRAQAGLARETAVAQHPVVTLVTRALPAEAVARVLEAAAAAVADGLGIERRAVWARFDALGDGTLWTDSGMAG